MNHRSDRPSPPYALIVILSVFIILDAVFIFQMGSAVLFEARPQSALENQTG